eukprot:1866610-Ditylum_brightwellii.AAC.1
MKEAGIMKCQRKKGEDMISDIFTKNCAGHVFDKHASKFLGQDAYMMPCHGTPKGRVLETACKHHGSAYVTIDVVRIYAKYIGIMNMFVV